MPFITHNQLLMFQKIAPDDRELSARLHFDNKGALKRVALSEGEVCVSGRCGVRPCNGGVCMHTHPRGNRVSSADFRVAIEAALAKQRTHSIVIAPGGVFSYKPSQQLLSRWDRLEPHQKEEMTQEWKRVGAELQAETQRGEMANFMEFASAVGMQMEYVPWEKVSAGGELWLA